MSLQRPSMWRVLSDTSRLISSNSLHFLALSLLFIFPAPLLSIIHTLLLQPSPSPLIDSHYHRLLSNPESLIPFIFNLCAVSSVTTSIFDGLRSKPLKLGASLKSILTSFLPLLSTQLVYFIITLATALAYGFCMGFLLYGLGLLGFEIEASSTLVMVVVFVTTILLLVLFVYLGVQWCLADAVAVVEAGGGGEARGVPVAHSVRDSVDGFIEMVLGYVDDRESWWRRGCLGCSLYRCGALRLGCANGVVGPLQRV